jgi:DNA-binding response OmpR family regulator
MKPRLLVVDDEETLRELYRLELGEDGYEVHTAANAKEAITRLAAAKYELIILDIQMPGMSGIDLLQRILGMDRHQSIILNTSYASHRENFMTWAADAFVVKSFHTGDLKCTVRKVLAQGSACVDSPSLQE